MILSKVKTNVIIFWRLRNSLRFLQKLLNHTETTFAIIQGAYQYVQTSMFFGKIVLETCYNFYKLENMNSFLIVLLFTEPFPTPNVVIVDRSVTSLRAQWGDNIEHVTSWILEVKNKQTGQIRVC